ncbi:MAG: hypothetical protein O7E57_02545 [Gammaproteobacteria bacterium]|nr:hypothetical protein [Gammaproteobacteria bacterium]
MYHMLWLNFAFNIYPDQVEFMQFLPVASAVTRIRLATCALDDKRETMAEARCRLMREVFPVNREVHAPLPGRGQPAIWSLMGGEFGYQTRNVGGPR